MTSIIAPVLRAIMLACVLGLMAGCLAEVQAQAPYGCACLHNNTQHTVKYRYHWGDNQWTNDQLSAGYQKTLCWRYAAGSQSSPNLSFQIDVDLSGGTAWTTYALPRAQSANMTCEAVARTSHYDISYRANTNRQYLLMTHRQ